MKHLDMNPKFSMIDFATPSADVSAFCRAILSNIIPNGFWGEAEEGTSNKRAIMRYVDQFIKVRRYENLTLHAIFQGLKVSFDFQGLKVPLQLIGS